MATTVVVSDADIAALVGSAVWPLARVSGFLMAAPVTASRSVPMRVRVVLALAVTALLAPVLPPAEAAVASAAGLATIVQQVAIGVALGLAVRLVFLVLELAGELVALQMGLGFAAMVDPQNGVQVPLVSQLYVIVATLLFLAVDGHLALIALLAESFTVLPVGTGGLAAAVPEAVLGWAGWLIAKAVLLAAPVVLGLLAVNLALGIMTRAAPQLNIFAVGFPVMIVLGIAAMVLALPVLAELLIDTFAEGFALARELLAS